jgi:branched-subunit amino acid transport protein AzlD
MWVAVLAGALGCYLLKLAGLSVPAAVLENRAVQRIAAALPIALLTALIVIQTCTDGHRLTIDARAAGLAAGAVVVLLRAPFLVVVGAAAATAALIRLLH